jgi:hypothetical protein
MKPEPKAPRRKHLSAGLTAVVIAGIALLAAGCVPQAPAAPPPMPVASPPPPPAMTAKSDDLRVTITSDGKVAAIGDPLNDGRNYRGKHGGKQHGYWFKAAAAGDPACFWENVPNAMAYCWNAGTQAVFSIERHQGGIEGAVESGSNNQLQATPPPTGGTLSFYLGKGPPSGVLHHRRRHRNFDCVDYCFWGLDGTCYCYCE